MSKRYTQAQAEALGFTVDKCQRPIGYKGPRFDQTAQVAVLTDLEEEMLAALQALMDPAVESSPSGWHQAKQDARALIAVTTGETVAASPKAVGPSIESKASVDVPAPVDEQVECALLTLEGRAERALLALDAIQLQHARFKLEALNVLTRLQKAGGLSPDLKPDVDGLVDEILGPLLVCDETRSKRVSP